jgi:hypothetical protein
MMSGGLTSGCQGLREALVLIGLMVLVAVNAGLSGAVPQAVIGAQLLALCLFASRARGRSPSVETDTGWAGAVPGGSSALPGVH